MRQKCLIVLVLMVCSLTIVSLGSAAGTTLGYTAGGNIQSDGNKGGTDGEKGRIICRADADPQY